MSTTDFLESAYEQLGLQAGSLLEATSRPPGDVESDDWIGKGEWLSLAELVGAEKVFFVEDNPVVVFARSNVTSVEQHREAINRIWCMARPRYLFFAHPGELRVLDLTRPPVSASEPIEGQNRVLHTIRSVADVQEQLAAYRREALESGLAMQEREPHEARADQALIHDLKTVRYSLIESGLSARIANGLIGRSIFIRYLEDRRVLRLSDFKSVAKRRQRWKTILDSPGMLSFQPWMDHVNYTKVLRDKEFTYALFDRVASEFTGDIFPISRQEREKVDSRHLRLLQRFFSGEIADDIPTLFFFAYRFDIIPIQLISSIYEAFYNAKPGSDNGTHYTPIELVEFVLSKVLSQEILDENPTILDPACGSGIFLVEAFHRIVRYRQTRSGRRLGLPELRKIIRDQLRGIDTNEEAVRVAAFSIYLAMLHHVDVDEILANQQLPSLTYDSCRETQESVTYDILLPANAFALERDVPDDEVRDRFRSNSFDVVVGNPPWGFPKKSDRAGRKAAHEALSWCGGNGLQVGDKELAQAFIHRTCDLLCSGGRAGLLVSSGVFFKHQDTSQQFRRQWLSACRIHHIANFAAARHRFFSGSVAPFASVVFTKEPPSPDHWLEYWCAKNTTRSKTFGAAVLSLADRRILRQTDAMSNDRSWKVYSWGSHHDFALIQLLMTFPTLESVAGTDAFGQGYKVGNEQHPSDWLEQYSALPYTAFSRYGPLPRESFVDPPTDVEARGVRGVYEGARLLIKKGPAKLHGTPGYIQARLETEPFCFTNAVHGVQVESLAEWQRKALLGILWSSLARYYSWMTSGKWGLWYDELNLTDIKRLPVAFPADGPSRRRLARVVDRLRTSAEETMFKSGGSVISKDAAIELEDELDQIVFEAYGITGPQKQLIADMCKFGIDLYHRKHRSIATRPMSPSKLKSGRLDDIGDDRDLLGTYVRTFLSIWNQELEGEGELVWHVIHAAPSIPMLAVIFVTADFGEGLVDLDASNWSAVLKRLDDASLQHDGSRRVYIDGIVRVVSDTEIIIVKRDERRFWSASMAREDADATIRQAMQLQGV